MAHLNKPRLHRNPPVCSRPGDAPPGGRRTCQFLETHQGVSTHDPGRPRTYFLGVTVPAPISFPPPVSTLLETLISSGPTSLLYNCSFTRPAGEYIVGLDAIASVYSKYLDDPPLVSLLFTPAPVDSRALPFDSVFRFDELVVERIPRFIMRPDC